MTNHTRSQKMAQAAYQQIVERKPSGEFSSFARQFPSLVHSCGLAQAIAFAKAKKQVDYLQILSDVLSAAGDSVAGTPENLERATREEPTSSYVRISRSALQAAGWLKRYVEATAEGV